MILPSMKIALNWRHVLHYTFVCMQEFSTLLLSILILFFIVNSLFAEWTFFSIANTFVLWFVVAFSIFCWHISWQCEATRGAHEADIKCFQFAFHNFQANVSNAHTHSTKHSLIIHFATDLQMHKYMCVHALMCSRIFSKTNKTLRYDFVGIFATLCVIFTYAISIFSAIDF